MHFIFAPVRRHWFALFSYGHLASCQNEIFVKTHIFGAVLLVFRFGCASPESNQLRPQQEDQLKLEVKTVADSIWAKWEQIDPQAALQYYWDSPDWMSFNSQGSRYDLQTYRKLGTDFKNSATAYKWTTTRQDFKVLAKDAVICTWIGKDEALWKSGGKTSCDPHAYTLVFRKIASQWKLVHSHDSGITLTQKVVK
jgi:hypothetical protein